MLEKKKSITDKMKGRIREAIKMGGHVHRVYFGADGLSDIALPLPCWGIYKLEHNVQHIPFHVDAKGRIILYEG